MTKKVLLVDDHPITLAGVQAIVKKNKSLKIIGKATDGLEAVNLVKKLQPDLIIMDVNMPNMTGIEAAKLILEESPTIKIIALSMNDGVSFVQRMLKAGALGYLLKDEAPEELLKAIESVLSGHMYLSSGVTRAALTEELDGNEIHILKTKLDAPLNLKTYTPRKSIVDKLEKNRNLPLSIISAAAGYGKSTIVSQWLQISKSNATWISLDEELNTVRAFFTYFCFAIEKVYPASLTETIQLIKSDQLPEEKRLLRSLINELHAIKENLIVVLDNYHFIREVEIQNLINKWLRFPPQNIQLCIISRRDPAININQLRASGQLTEIRMKDLSFSNTEIAALFKKNSGVVLSESQIDLLQEKTEGWPLGLMLATLLFDGKENMDDVIKSFSGSSHHVSDYLISEVLSKLPQHLKEQLAYCSLLDRFCAALIDAIIATEDVPKENKSQGTTLLKWLQDSNMFVVALDTEQKWFRFHHLFQDILKDELAKIADAKRINELHSKASTWFESNGFITEAINHAALGENYIRVTNLILLHWEDTFNNKQWFQVATWLKSLPQNSIKASARLLLVELFSKNHQFLVWDVSATIYEIEEMISELREHEMGYFALAKMIQSYFQNDGLKALEYGAEALQLIPKDSYMFRADIYSWWTMSMLIIGQGAKAVVELDERLNNLVPSKEPIQAERLTLSAIYVYLIQADFRRIHKRLDLFFKYKKIDAYRLGWGTYFKLITSFWSSNYAAITADFNFIRNNKENINPRLVVEAFICRTLVLQKINRTKEATALLKKGVLFALSTNDPINKAVIYSAQARLHLLQNNFEEAEQWLSKTTLRPFDVSMVWWVEIPAITYCRVLIASPKTTQQEEALALLAGYQQFSTAIFNTLRCVEIALLQTQVKLKLGLVEEAENDLKYALNLAAPGGFKHPFVALNSAIKELLVVLKAQGIQPDFIDSFQSLEVLEEKEPSNKELKKELTSITKREFEVLKLVDEGFSNQEIAEKLFRSEETVKKHIYNMFQKMDVKNRLSLVIKARDEGLFNEED